MPEQQQDRPTETELIAWAIPLIADGCYSIDSEEGGRQLTVYDDEPDMEFMEGALLYKRPAHQIAALKKAKDQCTAENILQCCVAYLGPVLGPHIAEQIEIPEFWRLVTGVFEQERVLVRSIQKAFVGERERLSTEDMERIESGALPEAHEAALVATYAREVAQLFPRLIERAASLSVLPATSRPPQQVQHYVAEATKCFIYGRFVSSLVMCRGALEEGIRDLIDRLGLEDEFNHFPPKPKEGDLSRMIRFSEERPILGVSWGDADQVRREANSAAHGNPPKPDKCRSSFEDTRSVLLQVYSLIPDVASR
jgi:hypothetical protein